MIDVVMMLVIAALAGLVVRLRGHRDDLIQTALQDAEQLWRVREVCSRLKRELVNALDDADFWLETYQEEQRKGFKLSRRLRILRAQRARVGRIGGLNG